MLQCKDPSDCKGAVSITGISIKAAEFASCSFKGKDQNGKEMNTEKIISGSDIYVRCDWEASQLKIVDGFLQ